jgi:hypothetical protein
MAKSPKGKQDAAALRQFRSRLAELKRLGVVNKKVNARSQKMTRHFVKKVRDLDAVLEGTVKAVKLKPKALAEFKAHGAKIVNGRVLVQAEPESVARARKGEFTEGVIVIRTGLSNDIVEERIVFPRGVDTIGDLIERMNKNPAKWDKLKNPTDYFAFYIAGRRSYATFSDAQLLADYLMGYATFDSLADEEVDEPTDFFMIVRIMQGTKRPVYPVARRKWKTTQDRRYVSRPKKTADPEYMAKKQKAWREEHAEEIKERDRIRKAAARVAKGMKPRAPK